MRDPYSVLGVRRDADDREIKAAWRNIAKAVHPDHNRDDPRAGERFAEVGRAYEMLKDPVKRSLVDRERSMSSGRNREQTIMQQREAAREAAAREKAAREKAEKLMEELARANAEKAKAAARAEAEAAAKARQTQASKPEAAKPAEDAEDMVNRIFGSGDPVKDAADDAARAQAQQQQAQQQSQQQAHQQSQQQQQSSAAEKPQATAPQDKYVESDRPPDEDGAKSGPPATGLGAVELIAALVRRFTGERKEEKAPDISVVSTVPLDDLLQERWATVTLSDGRDLRYKLEAGLRDGDVVRLKGLGLKPPGMLRGDVVVTVRVDGGPLFRVDGNDLRTPLPVTIENAVLGTRATVETPDGAVEVSVPAWSGSDQTIRIPGKGLPLPGGGRGDLIAEIRLLLWEKPDDKVTDLMRAMREGLYL